MSNIYDKAREFAKELENLDEVIAYREATKKINENEAARDLVEEFRSTQFAAYSEQVQSGQVSIEIRSKMEKVGTEIMKNKEVSEYINSEAQFVTIWQEVLKILNDAIGVEVIAPKK